MSDATVVIVSYRTPELTASAALSALADLLVREVIVLDNGLDGETKSRLTAMDDERLKYVRNSQNVGFGVAANRGAEVSAGSVLMFVNSDAQLRPGSVAALLSEVERFDRRCLAGARLIGPDGHVQPSAGLLPAPTDLTARAFGLHAIASLVRRWRPGAWLIAHSRLGREHGSAATTTATMDTSMVSGACFAIGSEAFWELGGFDERFFMYFEDADLCKRAAAARMPIRYVPSSVVTHIGGASSEGDYHFSPMHARSMRQYLEKWWGSPGAALAILLLWLRLIGHALVLHPGTGKAFAALRAALRP